MESDEEYESGDGFDLSETVCRSERGDALGAVFNRDIRPLIDLIDKLRRYGIQQDVALPNVVVVGDQSSGKSSIIEALSGVQLPRGKGIVTRCPLELQLKRVTGKKWKAKLSYRDKSGQEVELDISNPDDVEAYVRKAQEDICGHGKGVSEQMITLRLESPDETAPDLTLIDLPGIARIAVDDQPEDICVTVRRMIMRHVSNDRTVILCVISANLDVAVNESVQIARTVDPQGERTIGVLTKPDAAEESHKEDVLYLLNNEKVKLKKGYVMVKCRSQPELDAGISLKQSIQNEKEFFETDSVYKHAQRSQLGTMNLAKKISEELVNVIKKSLPDLKTQIENSLQKAHEELDHLADAVPTDEIEKQAYLTRIIWSLNSVMKESLNDGRNAARTENYFYRWRQLFTDFLKDMDDKTKAALKSKFSSSNLKDIIARNRGRELNGFLDFSVFKDLIPNHIRTYEIVAIELCKNMRKNVEECLARVVNTKCDHLPEIAKDLKEIINEEAKNFQDEAVKKIKFIFRQESIIFTMDVVFNKEMAALRDRKLKAIQDANRNNRNGQMLSMYGVEDDEDTNPEEMHDMMKVYLDIVNHRLSDNIPLTIMQCFLMELAVSIEGRFINLCTAKTTIEKVRENKVLFDKRKNTKEKIIRLQKANTELSRF